MPEKTALGQFDGASDKPMHQYLPAASSIYYSDPFVRGCVPHALEEIHLLLSRSATIGMYYSYVNATKI
jgi:hypothetical protein